MRVLLVTPNAIDDPVRAVAGTFQRLRVWLDAAREAGATIELASFVPAGADVGPERCAAVAAAIERAWGVTARVTLLHRNAPREESRLGRLVRPLLALRHQAEFALYAGEGPRRALEAVLARGHDLVIHGNLHAALAAGPAPACARVWLDLDDIETRKAMHGVAGMLDRPRGWWRMAWLPARFLGERALVRRFERVFVCSGADRDWLHRVMGARGAQVLPNSIATVPDGVLAREPNVLFLGTYRYGPNREAAEFLMHEVWPRLRRRHPSARLIIAGPYPEEVRGHASPPEGVTCTGFVDDLAALYARTRVMCCTVLTGGGTRVKILEAAAHGVPVVSTRIGAEGLDLAPEREVLLRDDPEGLAQACARVLADDALATRLGAAGRDAVRARYARSTIVMQLAGLMREAMRRD